MGQVFSQLTQPNTALQSPSGQTMAVGTPQQIQGDFYKQGAQANASLTPGPSNFSGPHIGTPSFQEAASAGAMPGGGNAMSPGLTKAGKLVTLLTSGIQGALAGRAKSEETTAETGGRRSGGAGMGFEAGYMLPWQRAGAAEQLAQQQAQTGLLQAEQGNINVPGVGVMPAWLAKSLGPAGLAAQSRLGAAQIGAGAKENVAQTAAGAKIQSQEIAKRYIPVPGVGLYDTQTRQTIPGTQQGIVVTPEIQKDYDLPPEFIGKPMSLSNLSSIERAQSYQNVITQGAGGPALVNRNQASPNFGRATPLGLGNPSMGRPVQVGDPNNPGNTMFTTAGNAVAGGLPGPASASVTVPKKAMSTAVPTRIGDQTVAFNTAIQHAQLLRQAAQALNNGNTRLLNSISNQAKSQFGDPNLTNFNAIANAYNHEVSSVIAKGHITDKEVSTGGATMPSNANFATINKVLDSYQSLMQSKMNMLNNQVQAAVRASQPKKTGGTATQSGNDPLGIR